MTENLDVVLATGDAHVAAYERTFDRLVVRLVMWDESEKEVVATGVGRLQDAGTWECDAVVRDPSFDDDDRIGYAVIDTEGNRTLQFSACDIAF